MEAQISANFSRRVKTQSTRLFDIHINFKLNYLNNQKRYIDETNIILQIIIWTTSMFKNIILFVRHHITIQDKSVALIMVFVIPMVQLHINLYQQSKEITLYNLLRCVADWSENNYVTYSLWIGISDYELKTKKRIDLYYRCENLQLYMK